MKMKLLLTALTSLIGTAVFAAEVPPVGALRPDFSLPDASGKTHSLSQYKGKVMVLEWFNPQCPFVKKHYGSSNMQNLQKEFTDKGVIWLTIDSNAPGTEGSLTPEEAQRSRRRGKHMRPPCCWIRRQRRPSLRLEKHAEHGGHQSGRKIIYRGAIDSKPPKPVRYPEFYELRENSAGAIAGRQVCRDARTKPAVARLNTNPRRGSNPISLESLHRTPRA
jgi:hypothetical protein